MNLINYIPKRCLQIRNDFRFTYIGKGKNKKKFVSHILPKQSHNTAHDILTLVCDSCLGGFKNIKYPIDIRNFCLNFSTDQMYIFFILFNAFCVTQPRNIN